jgi:Na+/phosphate symporter
MKTPLPLTPEAFRAAVLEMCEAAGRLLRLAREAFLQPTPQIHERIADLALDLHKREKHLTDHVAAQLRQRPWSLGPAQHLAFLPAALERIGDSVEALARCERTLHREGLACSERAITDIMALFGRAVELVEGITATVRTRDRDRLEAIRAAGDAFQASTDEIAARHQERVLQGVCLPRVSSIFLSMLDAFREVERYARRMSHDLEKTLAG